MSTLFASSSSSSSSKSTLVQNLILVISKKNKNPLTISMASYLTSSLLIALFLVRIFFLILPSSSSSPLDSNANQVTFLSRTHRKILSERSFHHHHQHHKNTKLFDFTPFKRRHRKHGPTKPDPGGEEDDPLYGSEKRRVPSGPNPLHH